MDTFEGRVRRAESLLGFFNTDRSRVLAWQVLIPFLFGNDVHPDIDANGDARWTLKSRDACISDYITLTGAGEATFHRGDCDCCGPRVWIPLEKRLGNVCSEGLCILRDYDLAEDDSSDDGETPSLNL